jgi:hypothetical protein
MKIGTTFILLHATPQLYLQISKSVKVLGATPLLYFLNALIVFLILFPSSSFRFIW